MSVVLTVKFLDGESVRYGLKDLTKQDMLAEVHDAYTVSNYVQLNLDDDTTVCLPTRSIQYLRITEEPDES